MRVPDAAGAKAEAGTAEADPYRLGGGREYYVVHAEMMPQHRWIDAAER